VNGRLNRLSYQSELVKLALDLPGLSAAGKREVIDLLFSHEGQLAEIHGVFRGLGLLAGGGFVRGGLREKQRFLSDLRRHLEGRDEKTLSAVYRLLGILSGASGMDAAAIRREAAHGMAERVLEVARTDPCPRIRVGALLVLLHLGAPGAVGACLEDYLPGVHAENAMDACEIVRFIVEAFGPAGLKRVILHLGTAGKPLPLVVAAQVELLCETHLPGLDAVWGVIELDRLRGTRAPDPGGERVPAGPGAGSAARAPGPARPEGGARASGGRRRGRGPPPPGGEARDRFRKIRTAAQQAGG